MSHFLANLLLFGRVLRRTGLEVHHGRLLDAAAALDWIDIGSRTDVRAVLSALLVHRHEDLAIFDAAFDAFFRVHAAPSARLPLFSLGERPRVVVRAMEGAPASVDVEGAAEGGADAPRVAVGAYSAADVSRTKDFGEFTPSELEQARLLLTRLPWQLGQRRTRRWRRARGLQVDLRPVIRRNLLRGGEVLELPRRRRREAPRPVVLIGDVSGSMDRYSRMLLHFVYGLARSDGRVESFVFATRLTRVTRRVAEAGSRGALSDVVREVQDWGGGTRIGEALRTFNTRWSRRVVRNGPIVLIVSDGWDRGEPALLARELARVRRSCRRVIWLNPLLGTAGYEPLTRGMQAALRHIDDFLPVHNLESLEKLAAHLRTVGSGAGGAGRRLLVRRRPA